MHIGGTFQSIAGDCMHRDVIPAYGGLHFTLGVTAQKPLAAHVRCGDSLEMVEPPAILANDWATTIEAAMPRLCFA